MPDSQYFDEKILALARVPEHSLPLMRGMSEGEPFVIDDYLFFCANDWLMAIAYPLVGRYAEDAFSRALQKAQAKSDASVFFAIGPELPAALAPGIARSDRYYVLPAHAPIPPRLRNPVAKAAASLRVVENSAFTAAHRRLWAEFLETNSSAMPDRVAELYARTPVAMAAGNLRLLDAVDKDGNLAASLLLDYGPKNFASYVIGAHSRQHYVPHATDLLFAEMLRHARDRGKKFVHLGLGVNDGILRFKRKWGARPHFRYLFAQWEKAGTEPAAEESMAKVIALALMRSSPSARQFLGNEPQRKPFAMLWQAQKNDAVSWIGGTAHFFCHSFEPSFRRLFRQVDTVIFEGPLDADFMARVDQAGKRLPAGHKPLADLLTEAEIKKLEAVVLGPRGPLARALGMEKKSRADVRWLLRNALPWCAFFTLWTAFLERMGWHESVDMEAWRIARDMGKEVIGMESLEEQLESLGSLPVERVLRFFRSCSSWKRYARQNQSAYLAGDLEKMMGSSAEFPTRTEHVVGRRDQRFRERMRPWLEKGRCAVFVGSAHMVNLRHMLMEDGFSIRQAPFGIWPRLHLGWRNLFRPDGKITWQL